MVSDTPMPPAPPPATISPPTPEPVVEAVNREPIAPMAGAEPVGGAQTQAAPAPPARSEAELRRVIADEMRAERKAELDELRQSLTAGQQPAKPQASPVSEFPPGVLDHAKSQLGGENADPAQVAKYAQAQTDYNTWWRHRNTPEYAERAKLAMSGLDDKMNLIRLQSAHDADRAERTAQKAKANNPQPASQFETVGQLLDGVRRLTPELLAEPYPALSAAMSADPNVLPNLLEVLNLHTEQDVTRAELRLDDALTLQDAFYKSAPPAPGAPSGLGNPGLAAPSNPAAAGHADNRRIQSADDFAAGQWAAADAAFN